MNNKSNFFFKSLIIGPSGIGQVHIRELIKNGSNILAILGKSYKKNRKIFLPKKTLNKIKIINFKKINQIKDFKPKIISICSPSEKHLYHLNKCKKYCKNFIIEKPFFWIKNKSSNYNYKYAKKFLKESKIKLFVNLPMVSLAKQVLYYEKKLKILNFRFNYFTSGKHSYDNIAIDLLPHAISFILSLQMKKLDNFKIYSVMCKKTRWDCKILINNCYCFFSFHQNIKRKKSILSFNLNKNFYLRQQVKLNNEYFSSLIKNKKKVIKLKNPINEYLKLMLNSFMNNMHIKKNNILALDIMKLTEQLINFKKIK